MPSEETSRPPRSKQLDWLSWIGTVLALAALVFVGRRLAENWSTLLDYTTSPPFLLATLLAAVGYGASNLLLSSAWLRLVVWSGAAAVDERTARSIFARSQLAKYVPGNIFHLAGRQLLGRQAGIGHRPLVASASLEAWGLVTAALTIAAFGLLWTPALATANEVLIGRGLPTLPLALIVIGLLVICLLFPVYLDRFSRLNERRRHRLGRLQHFDVFAQARLDDVPALFRIVPRYIGFFLISGSLLLALAWIAATEATGGQGWTGPLASLIAVAAIAWIGGYLTPGAPAGLGVREALLLAGLTPALDPAGALAVALAYRTATVTGDLLFWGFGRLPRAVGDA